MKYIKLTRTLHESSSESPEILFNVDSILSIKPFKYGNSEGSSIVAHCMTFDVKEKFEDIEKILRKNKCL